MEVRHQPVILLIDQDAPRRASLCQQLEGMFTVVDAPTVEEALSAMPRPYDAIVLDSVAPPQEGLSGLRALRSRGLDAPAVVFCEALTPRRYNEAWRLGAVRLLEHGSLRELVHAIQHAIESRHGVRGMIHGLSLVDILQMLHYARRSISITLYGPTPGRIDVQRGEIVYAVQGNLKGIAGLQRILAQDDAIIRTTPLRGDEQNLSLPFESLLLDALRLIDEDAKATGPEISALVHEPAAELSSWAAPGIMADFIPILERTVGRYCPSAKVLLMRHDGELVWLVGEEGGLPKVLLASVAQRAGETLKGWQWLERITPAFATAMLDVGNDDVVAMYMPLEDKTAAGRFRMALLRAHEQLRTLMAPDPPSRRVLAGDAQPDVPPSGVRPVNKLCERLVIESCKSAVGCRVWDGSAKRFMGGYRTQRGAMVSESAWELACELVDGSLGRALAELSADEGNAQGADVLVRAEDYFMFGHTLPAVDRHLLLATSRHVNLGMITIQMRSQFSAPFVDFFRA